MEFKKYMHVERLGTSEVEGILEGQCFIFPKIDGTNSSLWLDSNGELCAGSRNRQLSLESDNAGFFTWARQQQSIIDYLKEHPSHRLFGEWLVPHALKTYRDTAWRDFYVFDVAEDDDSDRGYRHLSYDEYRPLLNPYRIDVIPPLAIIDRPSEDQLIKLLDRNDYLIQDGKGTGEGIVIKNYDFFNRFGRQTWAKIVTTEFKEKHRKENGVPKQKGEKQVEREIVDKYLTKEVCEKVLANITNESDGFSSKQIPRLLNTVYYDFIREESWNFVKGFKNPTVDFKKLQQAVFAKVKEFLPMLF